MKLLDCLPLIAVMAGVTYLIRMLPLALIRGKLRSRFLQRFLYYIPYAVLSAMTFPAIFTAAGGVIPSVVGTAVGVVMAWKNQSLLRVALAACLAAWLCTLLLQILPL